MSIVIGLNMGFYALLVSDTRTTYGHGPGDVHTWQDGDAKVKSIGLGLMTGVGVGLLLDHVTKRVAFEQIPSFSRASEIMREERRFFLAEPSHNEETRACAESATYWFATYMANAPDARTGLPQSLRFVVAHPQHDYKTMLLERYIAWPHGVTDAQREEFTAFLIDNLRPMTRWDEFEENLAHHVGIASTIIGRFAEVTPVISASYQYGVHTALHDVHVSKVITQVPA